MHPSTYDFPVQSGHDKTEKIRKAAKEFSDLLERELPDGPDKTWVLRNHRTTVMWASVALLRQPDGTPR